jgi:hypothetical protein
MRCFELRVAISTVRSAAIIGPNAWWMQYPNHLLPHSVPPIWAPFHERDALDGPRRREAIHDLANVRRSGPFATDPTRPRFVARAFDIPSADCEMVNNGAPDPAAAP